MESIGPNGWATAAWLAEATAFVDRELAARGETRIGELEQPHLRPWATALRAQTSAGVVWLKAMGRGTAFETRIYPLLRAVVPARTLEPLAVDECTRGGAYAARAVVESTDSYYSSCAESFRAVSLITARPADS